MANALNNAAKNGGLRVTIDGASGSGKSLLMNEIRTAVSRCPDLSLSIVETTALTSLVCTIDRVERPADTAGKVPVLKLSSDIAALKRLIDANDGIDVFITENGSTIAQVYASNCSDGTDDDDCYSLSQTNPVSYSIDDVIGWCLPPRVVIED